MKYPITSGLVAIGMAIGMAACAKQSGETKPAGEAAKPAAAVPVEPAKQAGAAEPAKEAVAVAGPRDPSKPLKPGDEVTPYALGKIDWIQGSAPPRWEAGKVYIFECWAVWCGPCVAAIPHVNELHKKFESKGLRVFGINVWEDGKDKVAEFVSKKGDGMSYPVAYTGKGGVFETEWLKPAGVRGIPHAFVVRDGKLLFTTHPVSLTEELVGKLLEGGAAADAVVAEIREKSANAEKMSAAAKAFAEASKAKDIPAMEKVLAEMKQLDPGGRFTTAFALDVAMAKKDWAEVEKLVAGPGAVGPGLYRLAGGMLETADVPPTLIGTVADGVEKLDGGEANPMLLRMLAGLRWKQGKKDDAIAAAKKAVESVKQPKYSARVGAAPFEKYLAALEAGTLPSEQEFAGWSREARSANARPASPVK